MPEQTIDVILRTRTGANVLDQRAEHGESDLFRRLASPVVEETVAIEVLKGGALTVKLWLGRRVPAALDQRRAA